MRFPVRLIAVILALGLGAFGLGACAPSDPIRSDFTNDGDSSDY